MSRRAHYSHDNLDNESHERIDLETRLARLDLDRIDARRKYCDIFIQWCLDEFEIHASQYTPTTTDTIRLDLWLVHLPTSHAKQWCRRQLQILRGSNASPLTSTTSHNARVFLFRLMDEFVNFYNSDQHLHPTSSTCIPVLSANPSHQCLCRASAYQQDASRAQAQQPPPQASEGQTAARTSGVPAHAQPNSRSLNLGAATDSPGMARCATVILSPPPSHLLSALSESAGSPNSQSNGANASWFPQVWTASERDGYGSADELRGDQSLIDFDDTSAFCENADVQGEDEANRTKSRFFDSDMDLTSSDQDAESAAMYGDASHTLMLEQGDDENHPPPSLQEKQQRQDSARSETQSDEEQHPQHGQQPEPDTQARVRRGRRRKTDSLRPLAPVRNNYRQKIQANAQPRKGGKFVKKL